MLFIFEKLNVKKQLAKSKSLFTTVSVKILPVAANSKYLIQSCPVFSDSAN